MKFRLCFWLFPKKNQSVIDSKDKLALFKKIQGDCRLQDSDIQIDAAQPFTKQLLQGVQEVKEAIQYLKSTTKNMDLNKINADSKATTKYVVDLLNDTICKDFYPDIDFGKIRESAAKNTRSILEKKHCQRIDSYILRTEGTAV